MLTWLKKLISLAPKFDLGVVPDPRSAEEKIKDYQHEEVATEAQALSVVWQEKPQAEWRRFPNRYQGSSFSCVAQSIAKVLGVENVLEEKKFIELSARDIYDRRFNKPEGGMWGQDVLRIATKYGACLETSLPSQHLSETAMNQPVSRTRQMLEEAATYRGGGYVEVGVKDIDTLASIIATGKAVLLFFQFNSPEWDRLVPLATDYFPRLAHGVAAVDYFLYQGQKCLLVEDSAFPFHTFDGARVITERFLKSRCYYAAYLLDLKNERPDGAVPGQKPKHYFSKTLRLYDRGPEVEWLQDVLRYEEFFPQSLPSTGYYGQITAKGVLAWQRKHQIAPELELILLQGGTFGPKSLNKINDLYA